MMSTARALIQLGPIRPMLPLEEGAVRALCAVCHPEIPPRPAGWYTAYPTLVARFHVDQDEGSALAGFTSFSVSPALTGVTTLWGNDLCVAPDWRGQGLGWELAQARVGLGRAVGASTFVGITQLVNAPMHRIFERQGFHPCQILRGYWQGADALAWVGPLA